jgi:chromosome segregation ATPase
MTAEKLREDLNRLRAELSTLARDNSTARDKLDSIINDIEQRIQEPDDASAHHGLLASIRDAIRHFEAEHPRATAILNDIMVTLSNMGI